uniref:Uncharacterized protein n=1 Tax=Globodera pallida TaxID=36090 RepID=A0A183BQB5_GLOPA
MREIFKQSDGNGTSSMEIDQQQSPSTMTPNAFMEMLLTKMVAQLLPILHQSEQNVLLDQQLSKLTPEQNLLILLELFDVTNNIGKIFLNKLKRDERRQRTDNFGSFPINLGYYKEMMRKFEFAEELIKVSLKNDFKRSATYWFDSTEHFDVTISSHKPENIFGLKLADYICAPHELHCQDFDAGPYYDPLV